MTEATLALAAGCVLQIAETTMRPTPQGWLEETHAELVADPQCLEVRFPLPAHTTLVSRQARTRWGDGKGAKLGEVRWELTEPALDGSREAVLHLPELVSGDRVIVDVARTLPPGPVQWRPGPARYWQAEAKGGATVAAPDAKRHARRARVWASPTDAEGTATFIFDGHRPQPAVEALQPAKDLTIRQHLTLHVPEGDAQVSLFPGGGSHVDVEMLLEFGPEDALRGWVVPAPPNAEVAFTAKPQRVADLVWDAGIPRVRVAPFEGVARVSVSWTQADAPTFGTVPPGVDTVQVEVADGEIAWFERWWTLQSVRGQPVVPPPPYLVDALDHRFRRAALPEPAIPATLRGQQASWTVAEQLRPVLFERVTIGRWKPNPMWPRPLLKARREGAMTPIEATLTLWLYARQLQLAADWVLVRPAVDDPKAEAPWGFTRPVVRVEHDGEVRWIDATCRVCAPFELPPELQGQPLLGPEGATPPPLRQGRLEATVGDEQVVWSLDGPAALALRLWLHAVPAEGRRDALAERVGGPGATLVAVDGLEDAGASVRVVATRGAEVPDPLMTDVAGAHPWVGKRLVHWPDHALEPVEADFGSARYARTRAEGRLTELLELTERPLSRGTHTSVHAVRMGSAD